MFVVENVIRQIELSDMRSMCVVGEHKSGKHEILELSLPDKITVESCQEGLVKNSDLKMRSGGYTLAPVTQMKALWNQKKIIVSMEEQTGASLYNLESEESDLISRVCTLKCDLVSPFVALNNKGLVLLTAKDKTDIMVMDIEKNQIVYNNSLSENEPHVWLEPCFVSENLAALCNRYTGTVILQDIRSSQLSAVLSNVAGDGDLWTMASSGDNKITSTVNNAAALGLLSRMGKLVLYDIRKSETPSHSCDIGKICNSVPTLKLSPDNSHVVSVSGFDDNVYIFNISHDGHLSTVFVHDGHKHHSGCVRDTSVTCHLWYRDSTIISAALNKSLQCWQFIP